MREHALRPDGVARLDAAAQSRHRRDLTFGKIRIAEVVTRIGDLNADRTGIDVGLARPGRSARVPSAAGFRHHLHHAAVFEHQIVRGYFAAGCAQAIERDRRIDHAGIVQQDHIGPHRVAALAMIGRRPHLGDHTRLCWEHGAQHRPEIRSRSLRLQAGLRVQVNEIVEKIGRVAYRPQALCGKPPVSRRNRPAEARFRPRKDDRAQVTVRRPLTLTFSTLP